MSPPFFALLLGFIGAPLLIYLIFGLIGKQPLLGKLLFKLLPASDPQFVRFMQWVILWFLMFGTSQLMYTWIRRTLSN
jgi:hypothetical protein